MGFDPATPHMHAAMAWHRLDGKGAVREAGRVAWQAAGHNKYFLVHPPSSMALPLRRIGWGVSERASRPARARRAQCAHACDARAVHCVLYLVYARHGDARLRSHSLRNRLHHRCPFVPRAGQAHPPAEKPADAALSGRHAAAAPRPGLPSPSSRNALAPVLYNT